MDRHLPLKTKAFPVILSILKKILSILFYMIEARSYPKSSGSFQQDCSIWIAGSPANSPGDIGDYFS